MLIANGLVTNFSFIKHVCISNLQTNTSIISILFMYNPCFWWQFYNILKLLHYQHMIQCKFYVKYFWTTIPLILEHLSYWLWLVQYQAFQWVNMFVYHTCSTEAVQWSITLDFTETHIPTSSSLLLSPVNILDWDTTSGKKRIEEQNAGLFAERYCESFFTHIEVLPNFCVRSLTHASQHGS